MARGREQSGSPASPSSAPKRWLPRIGLSAFLAAVVLLFTQDFLLELPPLKRLELTTVDYRFRQRGPLALPQESLKVVILEISQESFASLPAKWPWPRSYYARVLRNLKRAGALVVGIDYLFSETDIDRPEHDEDLRKALRETRVGVLAGKTEIGSEQYVLRRADENYGSIFFPVDSSIGIVYLRNDDDGIYRRYRPFTFDPAYQRKIPSFSFAVLNKLYGKPPFDVASNEPDDFVYRDRRIPKVDDVSMLINFYGPDRTFRHIKFADVMDDQEFTTIDEQETGEGINTFDDPDYGYLTDGTFANKIVLIGSTMPEDKDLFPVPVAKGHQAGDNLMYGVEIHSNVIQSILDGNFLRKEPQWLEILSVILLCTLTFFATTKLSEIKFRWDLTDEILSALVMVAELGGIVFVSIRLFTDYGYVATMTSPVLAVVTGFVGATAYDYIIERKQKMLIKGMFSHYVNPTVVEELVAHPEKLRLGGERKEMTVLFSDIAGFTTISESLQPENLVALLNEYLSAMTEIIFTNAGTLDKYEGDAVMAFWGAPIPQTDHALRACRASLEMQENLKELRKRWLDAGKPKVEIRIGLSSGDMVVGNMGGTERFDYTVMGDTVNLGSRLEGANKEYRTDIMISDKTYQHVKEQVIARKLDLLVVKGKTEPIAVYELVGLTNGSISPKYMEFLGIYNQGLEYYFNRQWQEAMQVFQRTAEMFPNDYPSFIYFKRAKTYSVTPPPPNWNGAYVLTTK